jgi:hypothetical protein
MGRNAAGNSCHEVVNDERVYVPGKNGCPIKEAQDSAQGFMKILLDGTSNLTQVGYVPYRGCFNEPIWEPWDPNNPPNGIGPWPQGEPNPCVRSSDTPNIANVTPLSADAAMLQAEIDLTRADVPGSGTNTCWALYRAHEQLNATTQSGDIEQFVVLLADGNNVYYNKTAPPPSCEAQVSGHDCDEPIEEQDNCNDESLRAECNRTFRREANLDVMTWERAQDLEADGVEIYVVGFGVCGATPTSVGTCNGPESDLLRCVPISESECDSRIGDPGTDENHDNTADRRLLKCIATSEDGTNDHYFEVSDADALPGIFQVIAFEIASRSLSEDGL